VLELYHNINPVCAQKVRIALEEKGQKANAMITGTRPCRRTRFVLVGESPRDGIER
jgi:hypothetical protein